MRDLEADTGKAFAAALENDGWVLARGDRRDFVIIDHAGEPHSLAKRIDGARAAQVRERMADVEAARLPSVQEAKALQIERRSHQVAALPEQPGQIILKVEPRSDTLRVDHPLQLSQRRLQPPPAESPKSEGMEVAGHMPEGAQRSSVEVENSPPTRKPDEIDRRPAPTMFRQLYTAAAEITQRVLDKAKQQLFDRPPSEEPKLKRKPPVSRPRSLVTAQEMIQVSDPPRLAEPAFPEQTRQERQDQAIQDRIEHEQHSRARMTIEQLRAQLERQRSQGHDHDG